MMLWSDRHARYRDRLSAYIDGQLTPAETQRLESHLADCDHCRLQVAELRATAAALRALPELAVPRSFALTAAQAAPRSAPSAVSRTPALRAALPVAAAAFAVALAVVFTVDRADVGPDNGGGSETQPLAQAAGSAVTSQQAQPPANPAASADQALGGAARSASTPSPMAPPGGVAGPVTTGGASAAAARAPAATAAPGPTSQAYAPSALQNSPTAAPQPAAFNAPDESRGGVSTLGYIEGALAALFGATVGGTVVLRLGTWRGRPPSQP